MIALTSLLSTLSVDQHDAENAADNAPSHRISSSIPNSTPGRQQMIRFDSCMHAHGCSSMNCSMPTRIDSANEASSQPGAQLKKVELQSKRLERSNDAVKEEARRELFNKYCIYRAATAQKMQERSLII
jgi:hypothetical protein